MKSNIVFIRVPRKMCSFYSKSLLIIFPTNLIHQRQRSVCLRYLSFCEVSSLAFCKVSRYPYYMLVKGSEFSQVKLIKMVRMQIGSNQFCFFLLLSYDKGVILVDRSLNFLMLGIKIKKLFSICNS